MGLLKKFSASVRPVALANGSGRMGQRHGPDATSALPDRVAAAYGRAPNIEEFDAEVRGGRKTLCCQSLNMSG